MKNDDLFEIIGDISDRHIEGAKKHKSTGMWKKWAAMAACLCIVVASVLMITLRVPDDCDKYDCAVDDGTSNNGQTLMTSETYGSLEELLKYLSRNDNHGNNMDSNGGGRSVSGTGNAVTDGAKVIAHNGYVYCIDEGRVEILNFDSEVKGHIDYAAHELFICEDKLVLKGGYTEGNEIEYESYSVVRIYDISEPTQPVFMDEYVQKGELTACYMVGEKVYLLTSDGVCACGYSRLDDLNGYVPSLTINGNAVQWGDEDIYILGEPTSVNYVAVTAYDVSEGELCEKQAFYADIDDAFFGEGWLAVVTQNENTQPEVYTFDEDFGYTGKIELAKMTGVPKTVERDENHMINGARLSVTSVVKYGDTFGVLGEYTHTTADDTTITGYSSKQKVLVATKNPDTDEGYVELLDMEAERCSIDDIFCEENRVILCVSTMYNIEDPSAITEGNKFVILEFDGAEIAAFVTGFITDRVNGVEYYYSYGSPYGELKTIIPMENGVYLRFNGTPNGFDIFDFSDSTPELLYKSEGETPEDERFDFIWHKFDNNIFGVMHMKMGEGEEIRKTEFSYRIYFVDPYQEDVFVLLNEYSFGQTDGFSSSGVGFEVFEYEGEYYFVSDWSEGITKIEW